MPRPVIVDRKWELKTFVTSLESPSRQADSILLIQDNSGQGKTRLLERYREHCQQKNIPVAHVDLKSGSLSPIDILRSIQIDLRPSSFPRCMEALLAPQLAVPSFQVRDNKALGQANYSIHTNVTTAGMSPEEQKQWWAVSAQAFLEDLLDLTCTPEPGRFVLLFDTFEKAESKTQNWITDHMLRMATPSRVSCLLIVLAGKQVPDPTGEWIHSCQRLSLQPLELEDWLEYAQLVKSSLHPEQIRQCYGKHAANPIKMAEIIDTFVEREVA